LGIYISLRCSSGPDTFFFSRSNKKDGRLRLWKFNFETGQLLVVWSGDRLSPDSV